MHILCVSWSENPEVLIASIALIFSFMSIIISIIFLFIQRTHNKKSLTPIPYINASDFVDHISVTIQNKGVGPLLIVDIKVLTEKGEIYKNLIDIMPDLPSGLFWDTFWNDTKNYSIRPGEDLELLTLSIDLKNKVQKNILKDIRNILKDLEIILSYKDIYGKKYDDWYKDLSWFGRKTS